MKRILLLYIFILLINFANAQNAGIGIRPLHPGAKSEVATTTQDFLLLRITLTQRNARPSRYSPLTHQYPVSCEILKRDTKKTQAEQSIKSLTK